MAETDVLKEFLVSIGFSADQSSLRHAQVALKTAETHVKRFADETHRGETQWARFFQQFRRSEGAQREHIDITNRLSKAYELFGISLKQIATLAAGGSILAAFTALTKSFTDLYYQAQQTGTTVTKLQSVIFAGEQVGITAQQTTAALHGLFAALHSFGVAQILENLGFDVIDKQTGKLKDTTDAYISSLVNLRDVYRTSGRQIAQSYAEIAQIPWNDAYDAIFRNDELFKDLINSLKVIPGLQREFGINLDDMGKKARDLSNQWMVLTTAFEFYKNELLGPWIEPAKRALKSIGDELLVLQHAFQEGGFNWGEIGKNAANAVLSGLSTIFDQSMPGWEAAGGKAADEFIKGFFTALWKAWRVQFDMFMDAVRSGLMNVPGVGGLPGVAPGQNELPQPTPQTQRRMEGGEGAYAPIPPKFQSGGVVPILAHAGEVVLGADLVRMMMDWLRGGGGFRPLVHVDNPDDFSQSFGKAMPGEGERGPGFGRPRHGDPFGLSGRRGSSPGLGDPKTALSAIEKFESGGRNVMNYIGDAMHTASGFFQITNSTWREIARRYGVDTSHYKRAMDAPRELQEQAAGALYQHEGFGPWAPYNAQLRSFLRAHPGFPGDSAPILGQSSAPLGTINNHRAGDRTVTINAAHNFNITGTDALAIGGAINSVTERTNADLVRNLTPVVQ